MAPSSFFLKAVALSVLGLGTGVLGQLTYVIEDTYQGNGTTLSGFFDMFTFNTNDDPNGGYVDYQSEAAAFGSLQLASVNGYGQAFIGVDHAQYYNGTTARGRPSLRLESKKTYNGGLFVADIAHMPGSICGVWPAFWTVGLPPNYPANGEIDIIENINENHVNLETLHTNAGCNITKSLQYGSAQGDGVCDNNFEDVPNQYQNQGCSVLDDKSANAPSYGNEFNDIGGGVYVMEWTSTTIKIWNFARGKIPSDISSGNPDPSQWTTPPTLTAGGDGQCDVGQHFKNHTMIFDTTFCGSYAGQPALWSQTSCYQAGWADCNSYVAANPNAFEEAYWLVNSVKIYQKQAATSTTTSSTTTSATSTSTTTSLSTTSSTTTSSTMTSSTTTSSSTASSSTASSTTTSSTTTSSSTASSTTTSSTTMSSSTASSSTASSSTASSSTASSTTTQATSTSSSTSSSTMTSSTSASSSTTSTTTSSSLASSSVTSSSITTTSSTSTTSLTSSSSSMISSSFSSSSTSSSSPSSSTSPTSTTSSTSSNTSSTSATSIANTMSSSSSSMSSSSSSTSSSSIGSSSTSSSVTSTTPSSASSSLSSSSSSMITSSSNSTVTTSGFSSSSSSGPVTGISSSITSTTAPYSNSSMSSTPMTTSTIYTTATYTVTKCPATVTNCPASSTMVVTSTIALYTTVCPVSAITTSSPTIIPTSSSALQSTTSTVYTTAYITVTQCPATVTNCPAHSTMVYTSIYALYTTVCPVSIAASSPATSSSAISLPVMSSSAISSPTATGSASASPTVVKVVTLPVIPVSSAPYGTGNSTQSAAGTGGVSLKSTPLPSSIALQSGPSGPTASPSTYKTSGAQTGMGGSSILALLIVTMVGVLIL